MYKILKTGYGFRLTFAGFMPAQEMKSWLEESRQALANVPTPFGVLIDMTQLKVLTPESQEKMTEGQRLYKARGMQRSAVLVESAVVKIQFQRLAKESGIYAYERYIDASESSNYEKVAMEWVERGTDPDTH